MLNTIWSKSLQHYIKHFGTSGSPKMWKMFVLCIWEQIYCTHEHITSLGECGNIEVATHECLLLTWERPHGNEGVTTWDRANNIWERERGMASKHDSKELWDLYGLPRSFGQYALCPPCPSTTNRTCNINMMLDIQHSTLDRSTNPQKNF